MDSADIVIYFDVDELSLRFGRDRQVWGGQILAKLIVVILLMLIMGLL